MSVNGKANMWLLEVHILEESISYIFLRNLYI